MDKIILERMEFYGYHGVLPEENRLGQLFFVDLELSLDLSAAGRSDSLADTVDYAEVHRLVKGIVEGKRFKLIEALAEHIASEILQTYTKIIETTVRITKPHPPFPMHSRGVRVEIARRRAAL